MAKRWAACRYGFYEEPEDQGGTRVPKINAYPGCNAPRQISSPANANWGMVQFVTNNVAQLESDPDIILFADLPYGVSWASQPNAARTAIRAKMIAAGFEWNVSSEWTVQRVLEYACSQLQPGYVISATDIVDPYG